VSHRIRNTGEVLQEALRRTLDPPKGILIEGWNTFNRMTGGLRDNEFTLLCGPSGAGKTLFLANLIARLIEQRVKVFVAPVETGEVDFVQRVLSVWCGFDCTYGEALTIPQREKLMAVSREKMDLITEYLVVSDYDGRIDIDEMIETLTMANDVYEARIAIMDNWNYMVRPSSAREALYEMEQAFYKLVQYVKKSPMHIMLVMHPKKVENGKLVSLDDLKGSSNAPQEAGNVLFFNKLTEDEQDSLEMTPFDREFVFQKMRKRGRWVGEKFYMRNVNANGRLEEIGANKPAGFTRGVSDLPAKWGRPPKNPGK
jgi:archaellum biogenesis ATPase FlaH